MPLDVVGETVVSGNSIEWTIKNAFSVLSKDKSIMSPSFYFKNITLNFLLLSKKESFFSSRGWLEILLQCLFWNCEDCSTYSVHFSIRRKSGEITEGNTAHHADFRKADSDPQFLHWDTLVQNKDELLPNGHLTIICYIHKKGDEQAGVKSRLGETSLVSLNQLKRDAAVQAISSIASESKDAVAFRGHFEAMYETGEFCDFDFKVQDRVFHTHKVVLAAESSAFASMLRHDMKEKKTGVVEIVDCDSDTFDAFLKFLYGGKNEVIIPENVASLYEVANKYDVQNLKAACRRYMMKNLSTELFCDVMCLALRHDEIELIRRATEYFKQNKKNIFLSVQWQIFFKENSTYANELLIKSCD